MKISLLIQELIEIRAQHGEIETQIQIEPRNDPMPDLIMNHAYFFVVPEEYEDGWFVNLRTWPY